MDMMSSQANIGSCTLYMGDCLQVVEQIADKSIDVVCTSPPYNIGLKYGQYQDNLEYDEYLAWMEKCIHEWKRILKDDGSLFLNIGNTNSNPWLPMDVASRARKHIALQNNIVWVKSITINLDDENTSHGHFKPINSERFMNTIFENVFHFTKDGNVPIHRMAVGVPYKWKCNQKSRLSKKEKEEKKKAIAEGREYIPPPKTMRPDRRCAGNTWFIPYETVNNKSERFHHPASFPVELARRCIVLHGVKDGMRVLDPFLGTGSTLVACHNLSDDKLVIEGIGIEIDPVYIQAATTRLFNHISMTSDV